MASPVVGSARVVLVPSAQGFERKADAELSGPAASVGESVGKVIGRVIAEKIANSISDGIKASGRKATPESTKQGDSAGGAFARAFKAKLDLALKDLPDAKIDADSSDADRKIAAIRADIEALGNTRIGVDISDRDALVKIASLRAQLAELGLKSTDVTVRADTRSAGKDLLGAASIFGAGGAAKDIPGLSKEISSLTTEASSAGSSIFGIGASAIAAGVVAVPAIAGIGVALAAIASTVLVATGGLAALALVAVPAIKGALSAKGKQGADTVAFLSAVSHFKGVFAGLVAGFKPQILQLATQALNLFSQLLPSLKPLIAATAATLLQLFSNGSQFVPVVNQIVAGLAKVTPGAILALAQAFEIGAPALAELVIKLAPLGDKILPALVKGAVAVGAAIGRIGQSTTFQQIFAAIRSDAPAAVSLLKALVGDIEALAPIIGPLAALFLTNLKPALDATAAALRALKTVIGVVEAAFLAMAIVITGALLEVLSPIATFISHVPGIPKSIKQAVTDSVTSLRTFNSDAQASFNSLTKSAGAAGTSAGGALVGNLAAALSGSGAQQVQNLISNLVGKTIALPKKPAAPAVKPHGAPPVLIPTPSGPAIQSFKKPLIRAIGGPIFAGVPAIVGDRGAEMILPSRDAYVATAAQTRQLTGPLAASKGTGRLDSIFSGPINIYDALGVDELMRRAEFAVQGAGFGA